MVFTRWRVSFSPVATYTALANSSSSRENIILLLGAQTLRCLYERRPSVPAAPVPITLFLPCPMERAAKLYICMAIAKSSRLLRNWKKDLNSSKVMPWNIQKYLKQQNSGQPWKELSRKVLKCNSQVGSKNESNLLKATWLLCINNVWGTSAKKILTS